MKILFVDDEEDSVSPLMRMLERDEQSSNTCRIVDFESFSKAITEFEPDIVVLDLLQGGGSGEAQNLGTTLFQQVWDHRFCPILVYSSDPGLLEDALTHPFVKRVTKGSTSVAEAISRIMEFKKHIEALRHTTESVRSQLSTVLRDMTPHLSENVEDTEQLKQVIVRAVRRRLAAAMDIAVDDGHLKAWEQYLFPPMSDDVRLGDVLMRASGSADAPSDFFVVLTPSCDMVRSSGRKAKVDKVLVAHCMPLAEVSKAHSLGNKPDNWKDKFLTPGIIGGFIPIPELQGKIPHMAANLKDLELLKFAEIDSDYSRIASVDSPFRELISWTYMQVACRPGLPERDLVAWSNGIYQHCGTI